LQPHQQRPIDRSNAEWLDLESVSEQHGTEEENQRTSDRELDTCLPRFFVQMSRIFMESVHLVFVGCHVHLKNLS
jgi:hypothetical protein